MSLHFIFPTDIINPKKPDDTFVDQIEAFKKAGFDTALVDLERKRFVGSIPDGATLVYRGWMMTGEEYATLQALAYVSGYGLFTSGSAYNTCHYMPNWQPRIQNLTPKTATFGPDVDITNELHLLQYSGWKKFFLKDFVKSLKAASVCEDPEDACRILDDLRKYRGQLEGGICVREFEDFKPNSEVRYFVLNGIAHSVSGTAPDIVKECIKGIPSPFFSVDVAERSDGVLRVVEIGDGQVSDLVGWDAESFARIWLYEND